MGQRKKRKRQCMRHTKPCRYFQTGCCPHAMQEDCDFAHVFSDSASMPTTKQRGCHAQGTSTNGYGEEIADNVLMLQDRRYSSGIGKGYLPALLGNSADDMVPMDEILSPKAPLSAELCSSTGPFSHPQPPRKPINRRKLTQYGNRKCRYFKPGSVCLEGDACRFFHAEPDRNDEVQDMPAEANYFSSSWRVGGGGVFLSNAKVKPSLSADDESNLSEDSSDGHANPASHGLEIDFPSSDSNADTDDGLKPTGLPSRQRASSMPSTPVTSHVDMLHPFCAESPGAL
ncbi:hypothetical protein MVEN_00076300 [Mycena venus]|uniref:C3H1-type domain-containing protein n=1 Tax=Mycena venus TaxID=2733690 RepID=A0A8H6Z7G9_9AGAR|nr:hypothetical protein MVEN_00076300 [Mycena venus]